MRETVCLRPELNNLSVTCSYGRKQKVEECVCGYGGLVKEREWQRRRCWWKDSDTMRVCVCMCLCEWRKVEVMQPSFLASKCLAACWILTFVTFLINLKIAPCTCSYTASKQHSVSHSWQWLEILEAAKVLGLYKTTIRVLVVIEDEVLCINKSIQQSFMHVSTSAFKTLSYLTNMSFLSCSFALH